MLWNESARIVDPADYQLYDWEDWAKLVPNKDEPFVRTMRHRIRVPEVVTLNEFDRVPTATVALSRRNVFKRDRFTCQYCGVQPGSEDLTIDHVVPRSRGGQTSWENCVLACFRCNSRKADRTPDEASMRLKKKPIEPTWRPIYADRADTIRSWSKFISEAYWVTELDE